MLTNSQKEHLTYTAIGQVVTMVAIGIWTTSYILPGLDKIDGAINNANASIESYNTTSKNGLSFESIIGLIGSKPEYAELGKIMNADIEGTKKVIQKNGEGEYIDWLKKSIGSSSEDKEILSQEKKKLNSILPTLSPISGNIEEENIDLKGYIRFIEIQILKQFNFDTNLTLGMQGIVSGKNSVGMPENIGTFDLQIAFHGTNKDIAAFVRFINNSGNPEILTDSGILSKDKIPTVMSNPLITMVNFGINEPIDEKNNPTKENSGRATIRFYVRGISKDDITYLKENIKVREESLLKSINESINECKTKGAICELKSNRLSSFLKKFQEYKTSTAVSSSNAGGSTEQLYALAEKVNTLKKLESEFQSIISDN